jgi:hypothetical protein
MQSFFMVCFAPSLCARQPKGPFGHPHTLILFYKNNRLVTNKQQFIYQPPVLESLITSQTRIKLLVRFFLNQSSHGYLRGLADEFSESSNAIRLELNRFEKAGLLVSFLMGNKKIYKANGNHPLSKDIHSIVLKYVGIDNTIEEVISRMGNLHEAWITGDFAIGKDSKCVDILLIGKEINLTSLMELVKRAEKAISHKIRYTTILPEEKEQYLYKESARLLLWNGNV